PDDVLLSSTKRAIPKLSTGASRTYRTAAKLPANLTAGTYYLLAIADPINALAEPNPLNNVIASAPLTVAYQFGSFSGHPNAKVTVADSTGRPITFLLHGKGTGTVTVSPGGALSVSLDGTGPGTAAVFQTSGNAVGEILDVTINGSLKSL